MAQSSLLGRSRTLILVALALGLFLAACQRPNPDPAASGNPASGSGLLPTPTLANTAVPVAPHAEPSPTPPPAAAEATPIPLLPTASPFSSAEPETACGVMLPVAAAPPTASDELQVDEAALARLVQTLPDAARPALDRILSAPDTVGLAAFRLGQEAEGVYLNADTPMPLASVVKLVHLVAFAEAVASGELDPLSLVPLAEIERYYLPGLDLGGHTNAVAELEEKGRVLANPDRVLLEDVAWMMIRHSSNAATDYLHMRLGQERIEQTAVDLGLTTQTAPCPFLGQFLVMSNHTRPSGSDQRTVQAYIDNPESYGRDVMLLTDAYSSDDAFRQAQSNDRRGGAIPVQRLFSENLNAKASAAEYAALMALIAQNGLSDAESSFLARRFLEWPMQFEVNQELFSNLGYKNGSLPGVLATVYYAYPAGEQTPIVVALFYRDLPNRTYQRWRRNELAHDELARWLLYDPLAIPALRDVLSVSGDAGTQ